MGALRAEGSYVRLAALGLHVRAIRLHAARQAAKVQSRMRSRLRVCELGASVFLYDGRFSPRLANLQGIMADDIPFNRTLDLAPGVVEEVAPGVRRILVDNPSPFTFKGTLSYIVGRGKVAIIDPGPLDDKHIDALLDAVRGETVTHIVITHTHRDHSPAAAQVKAATGARRPMARGRTGRRGRCISARPSASMPAATPISCRTGGSPMARSSRATAGRWRRSRLPATPRTTWRTRCAAPTCCFPAIT